jgi:hypothetical protein
MAILSAPARKFKPSRVLESTWDSFRKGLNTLLRDSELSPEQAKQMQNLVLTGKGIVTQRPGSANLYQAGASLANTKVRGLFGAKINDVNELLAVSDAGYLTKKNGESYTVIPGASWASGYKVRMTQLRNQVYLVQNRRPMSRYDGSTLLSYVTLLSPVSLTATNLSGVTGTFTYSWRVAAVNDVGRTLASDPVVLSNLPENLDNTTVKLSWSMPISASGLAKNFEIYGRDSGTETRMTGVSASSNTWLDTGAVIPSLVSGLPDFNETGGPNAKFIIKSVGKIIVANVGSKKSRLMWSGADINAGKFSWTVGGGYCDIDEDDGTEITGIAEYEANKIIVWKERSIFQVQLTYNNDLGIIDFTISKISEEVGCMSADTIKPAVNNHFFIGLRPGRGISLNSLGYEPNIAAAVLRTADISKVIAPDLEAVNMARLEDMFAIVYGGVYWWFFPIGDRAMRCMGYDLERLSFNGPHSFPDNPVIGTIWYDSDGMPRFVYGDSDDNYVTEVSNNYLSDKGVDFQTVFTSKREDFKLPFKLKTLLKAFIHLADVNGGDVNVQLNIENDAGNTTTVSTFSVSANSQYSGFGSFMFGKKKFGHSDQASISSTNTSEVRRYLNLNTSDVVSAQFLVTATGAKYKLIETQLTAREQVSPANSWQVDD